MTQNERLRQYRSTRVIELNMLLTAPSKKIRKVYSLTQLSLLTHSTGTLKKEKVSFQQLLHLKTWTHSNKNNWKRSLSWQTPVHATNCWWQNIWVSPKKYNAFYNHLKSTLRHWLWVFVCVLCVHAGVSMCVVP